MEQTRTEKMATPTWVFQNFLRLSPKEISQKEIHAHVEASAQAAARSSCQEEAQARQQSEAANMRHATC
jgi:hypothetical protein